MHVDVVIIGAGAAGLMCAATAGYRGRRVLVLDHARKAGQKILMSGGGRCNFTNLNSTPNQFLSANPRFCISALKRYPPQAFLDLVERHGIEHVEKAAGQLFCAGKAKEIVDMLLTECEWAGAEVRMTTGVTTIDAIEGGYRIATDSDTITAESLVIASGGLSIPTMGATPFGYEVARQFGLEVLPTRAGLVPFTLHPDLKERLAPLAGMSIAVAATASGMRFEEPLLFTHRGLSGPAMLQISSFWQPGEPLVIDLLPGRDAAMDLAARRAARPQGTVLQYLDEHLPRRLGRVLCDWHGWSRPLQEYAQSDLQAVADALQHWAIHPAGTEGYRTAEVTLGGVDTRGLSSQTMEAQRQPGLFFIGEVVDVTGHLGGHNFQWAWASGVAAGQVV
ncbi:aminoacetone oxidase family FAD-binding enzyme [Guyparkeria halopsychrophila]|uniref:NAD(P)/FAD-dependent oxidoreductase n=1 Tax=Guyparkeria halopsychrophila TaxID=3139421 RepID=UPI0037C85613